MTSTRTLIYNARWLHELAYPLTSAEEASALMLELSASSATDAASTPALDSSANLLYEPAVDSTLTSFASHCEPLLRFEQATPIGINPSIAIIGTNGKDTLYGTAADDTLDGADGNDQLYGLEGNDSLIGGGGADTIIGGTGNDHYYVDNVGDVVIENANEGIQDWVYSSISYILGSDLERLYLIGTTAINGTGNAQSNRIYGNSGANILDGGDARDYLYGYDGHDILIGGNGSDRLFGDNGNDSLIGGDGADTLVGGAGNDRYFVDDVGDVAIEAAGAGTDRLYSSASFILSSNVEQLYLTGISTINGSGNTQNNNICGNVAANILDGSAGNDTLSGGDGNDSLIGGDGNDHLRGDFGVDTMNAGDGSDTLTGGGGADQFVFNTALNASNADTITDFNKGHGDTIALDDVVFAQLAGITNVANHFRLVSQAAVGGDDYIVYNSTTGQLFYDASGNGTGTLELFAVLSNQPNNLTGNQFVVI